MAHESVLITDCDLPGTAISDTLAAAGHPVTVSGSNSMVDIVDSAKDAGALVVQWAKIDGDLMDMLPNLKFISRLGIGYDMIDVAAATSRGIKVANTPTYCTEEVATHTVAMILSQARGLKSYDHQVQAGVWSPINARPMSVRPSRATVSVIGLGRIGSIVAASCAAIGFNVIVSDPYQSSAKIRSLGYEPVELEDAIMGADILTLHAPLTSDTKHLINAMTLSKMKSTASIVNTTRGQLIDEEALADAIEAGLIQGAALDVFEAEPLSLSSRLRGLETVQLSPHSAWYSQEALADLPVHAALNVINFFEGRTVAGILNAN